MSSSYPAPYIVEPEKGHPHTHTIILLHGRSSTASEFARDILSLKSSKGEDLQSALPRGLRWVFPDAGYRWCTRFEEERSAWFDTYSLDDLSSRQDLAIPGLTGGIQLVRDIVEEEVQRLDGRADRIIFGGFSQGSAVALWSLFTGAAMTRGRFGAFVGLSAWMPFIKEAKEAAGVLDESLGAQQDRMGSLIRAWTEILNIEPLAPVRDIQDRVRDLPVYLGHGTDDALISITNCHDLSAIFRNVGSALEVREYVGAPREGHWVKEPEQVDDVVSFLQKVLVQTK